MSFVTQDGYSALILAASCGLTDGVVELVKAGANLDLQNEVSIFRPLEPCTHTVSYLGLLRPPSMYAPYVSNMCIIEVEA